MTDRELLELAAKAAGVVLEDEHYWRDGFWTRWNPLKDDGDALRLAVKLGLRMELDNEWRRSHVQHIPNGEWFTAPHNADPYSATRRAIVHAAAEIGKSM